MSDVARERRENRLAPRCFYVNFNRLKLNKTDEKKMRSGIESGEDLICHNDRIYGSHRVKPGDRPTLVGYCSSNINKLDRARFGSTYSVKNDKLWK